MEVSWSIPLGLMGLDCGFEDLYGPGFPLPGKSLSEALEGKACPSLTVDCTLAVKHIFLIP